MIYKRNILIKFIASICIITLLISNGAVNAIGEIVYMQAQSMSDIALTASKELTAEEIAANPKQYYGMKVNYKGSASDTSTYRIFYVDTENKYGDGANTVYLKADVNNDNKASLSTALQGNNNYRVYDYNLSTSKIKEMNPEWAKNRGDNSSSWQVGEKAAAYLTDTSKWTQFYNSDFANYAIGSPSLEMFVDSYNQTHNADSLVYKYEQKDQSENIAKGYTTQPYSYGYSIGENGSYDESIGATSYNSIDSSNNGIYLNNTLTGNDWFWLASSSSVGDWYIRCAGGSNAMITQTITIYNDNYCPIISLKSGFKFVLENNNSIELKKEQQTINSKLTAEGIVNEIAQKNNASDYYGKIVNYGENTGYTWQIFYIGKNPNDPNSDTNIYLTTTDYVKVADWPTARKGSRPTDIRNSSFSISGYSGDYNDILKNKDYDGSLATTESRIKKWVSHGGMSTQEDSIAMEYLLDSQAWNSKFKESCADYAIGAPTLDLFAASYKVTHPSKYIEYQINPNGYLYKVSTGDRYRMGFVEVDLTGFSNIYAIPGYNSKAAGIWLASLGYEKVGDVVTNGEHLLCAGHNFVDGIYCVKDYLTYVWGNRPIVCLNKDVVLESNGTQGSFSINYSGSYIPPKNIYITIRKDGTTTPISGVKIGICDVNGNIIKIDGKDLTLITDANGRVDFATIGNFQPGKYYYKIIEAPNGYDIIEKIYEFEVKEDGTVVGGDSIIGLIEGTTGGYVPPKNIYITIRKDGTTIPISGVKIGICDVNGNIIKIDGKDLTLITDANGRVDFATIGNFQPGKYYYKIIEAPNGYDIIEKIYEFEVKEDGTVVGGDSIIGLIESTTGGDSKKDDITGGDSKKDDITGGDSKKDDITGGDSKKDDIIGGDSKKDDIIGGDSKKDDITGGDSKKDDITGGDSKKDDIAGGDSKKDDITGGDSKKDDIIGGDSKKDDITGGDSKKDDIIGGDSKKDDITGGDSKKSTLPYAGNNNKIFIYAGMLATLNMIVVGLIMRRFK